MLRYLVAACVSALCMTGGLARADQNDPALDKLSAQLHAAKSPLEAQPLERAINDIWAQSNSEAIDYLMQAGLAALDAEDFEAAQTMFSGVTRMAPGYVEGWNKRATAYYLEDDTRNAVIALQHVLAIEPRQFEALFGLAAIFEEWGEKKRALVALRAAHALDPQLDGVAERIKVLGKEVDGRGI